MAITDASVWAMAASTFPEHAAGEEVQRVAVAHPEALRAPRHLRGALFARHVQHAALRAPRPRAGREGGHYLQQQRALAHARLAPEQHHRALDEPPPSTRSTSGMPQGTRGASCVSASSSRTMRPPVLAHREVAATSCGAPRALRDALFDEAVPPAAAAAAAGPLWGFAPQD